MGSITKTDGYYRDNIGKYSVVNRFEVQTQLDPKIPALAFGRIHVFTTNLSDTKTILNTITSHQLNKFRPFSLYKQKLNSNYPLHNSIWWPEVEDGVNYGES
ncbi:hypothetical protein [Aliiglaciecola sp. LCG003]|uniref:hypothetical protein n=1 Tax=Aliiglaciecola sp. LCG003 TaxID=3053655 RepID=UPI00257358D6|nr:hypothetical protein [Aliiglaciecola sp. LCG003]WJG09572.1 hypothetical protein QR722_00615 [Aliiglaciecola sp. LCG003]